MLIQIITAVVVSLCAMFVLRPIAVKIGLVDNPDGRKLHDGAIPLIGGIAFYLGTLTACLTAFPGDLVIQLFLFSSGLIVLLGCLDDYNNLSVGIRLTGQIIIASILVYGANRYIQYLGDLLGCGEIYLGVIGAVFTIVAVLAAINAFNMTDGIDGLAGFLALNTFISIAVMSKLHQNDMMMSLSIILSCAISPFLFFNLGLMTGPLKKIFMGDAGSMFIGLGVVWLLVLGTQDENPSFRPITAIWFIAVPLMDMIAIVIRRLRKGKSPFKADRDHLHHIFLRAGFKSWQALVCIVLIAIAYSFIGFLGEHYAVSEWVMFALFVIAFLVYFSGICHAWKLVRWVRSKKF